LGWMTCRPPYSSKKKIRAKSCGLARAGPRVGPNKIGQAQ